MTVIVYDGSSLAVDRSAISGGAMHHIVKARKVLGGGTIIVGAGDAAKVQLMMRWWLSQHSSIGEADFVRHGCTGAELIVCTITHGLAHYDHSPDPVEHRFVKCAFGEGRDFAYGALAMGATALKAARVACQYSPYCGGGVDVYSPDGLNQFTHTYYGETLNEKPSD